MHTNREGPPRETATRRAPAKINLTLEVVARLPNGKLPDRGDFKHYGHDLGGRVAAWSRAVAESERLAEELEMLIARGPGLAAEPL